MNTPHAAKIIGPCPTLGCDGDIWAEPGQPVPSACEDCLAGQRPKERG
jgi:hypothetical protein